MPRKTTTTRNPKQRSHKFAARGKGHSVESNDLQGLQAIRKAEVSKYNSVKNTHSAYQGQISRGRGFLKNLVAKRENDETDGPIDDGICTAVLAKAFDNGPPNKYSALALELFIVRNVLMKAAGRKQLRGFTVCLQDSGIICMSCVHHVVSELFIDSIFY